LGSTGGVALEPGRRYRLEFAFIDRRVTLALDGRVVVPPADLPPAAKREPEPRPVRRIGARGCRAVVRDLRIVPRPPLHDDPQRPRLQPSLLGPREYFVLGD
jgi:signal peptidase I